MHDLKPGWTTIDFSNLIPYNEKTMGDKPKVPKAKEAKTGKYWVAIIVLLVVILVLFACIIKMKMSQG